MRQGFLCILTHGLQSFFSIFDKSVVSIYEQLIHVAVTVAIILFYVVWIDTKTKTQGHVKNSKGLNIFQSYHISSKKLRRLCRSF